jgi:hypothetical protein
MGFVNLEKGEERKTGIMFKRSAGGTPRKQGLYLGQNPWRKEELAVIIGVSAIGALVYAGMDKQKVAMTELPAAVQKTINDNLGGGTVTERNLGNYSILTTSMPIKGSPFSLWQSIHLQP